MSQEIKLDVDTKEKVNNKLDIIEETTTNQISNISMIKKKLNLEIVM